MKSFLEHITDEYTNILVEAGGAKAGKLELLNTPVMIARDYAEKMFKKNGMNLEDEIPNFDKNYELAKKSARLGFARRKDMRVITNNDVRQ